jgi:hypothetical protein
MLCALFSLPFCTFTSISTSIVILNEISKRAFLEIFRSLPHLCGSTAEEHSFRPLPGFGTEEEQNGFHEYDAPFPRYAGVFEDVVVDNLQFPLSDFGQDLKQKTEGGSIA